MSEPLGSYAFVSSLRRGISTQIAHKDGDPNPPTRATVPVSVALNEGALSATANLELFGPGDIIRTWQAEASQLALRASIEWRTLERTSVAVMDGATALALRGYPEIMAVVLDRLNARAERLAVTQAISQITGVETRVEALLWHLSQRWGKVGRDGVIVGLALSHRMIGSLVGARRPTVSTALARLVDDGRVVRRADGSWLLTATEPPLAQSDPARAAVLAA